jgi:hypothetical protein
VIFADTVALRLPDESDGWPDIPRPPYPVVLAGARCQVIRCNRYTEDAAAAVAAGTTIRDLGATLTRSYRQAFGSVRIFS